MGKGEGPRSEAQAHYVSIPQEDRSGPAGKVGEDQSGEGGRQCLFDQHRRRSDRLRLEDGVGQPSLNVRQAGLPFAILFNTIKVVINGTI
jgi:hypothetical protein